MNVLFWLIPLSTAIALVWVLLFLKASADGNFENLDTAATDILFDDINLTEKNSEEISSEQQSKKSESTQS